MTEQTETFGQFLAGLFSEPDGNPSFSRVITFLAIMFVMVIHAIRFAKTGVPPDGLQLLESFAGASSPYGLNRVGRIFTKALPAETKPGEPTQ